MMDWIALAAALVVFMALPFVARLAAKQAALEDSITVHSDLARLFEEQGNVLVNHMELVLQVERLERELKEARRECFERTVALDNKIAELSRAAQQIGRTHL